MSKWWPVLITVAALNVAASTAAFVAWDSPPALLPFVLFAAIACGYVFGAMWSDWSFWRMARRVVDKLLTP